MSARMIYFFNVSSSLLPYSGARWHRQSISKRLLTVSMGFVSHASITIMVWRVSSRKQLSGVQKAKNVDWRTIVFTVAIKITFENSRYLFFKLFNVLSCTLRTNLSAGSGGVPEKSV